MNLQNTSKHASDEEGIDTKVDNFLDNPLIRREVRSQASKGFLLAKFQTLALPNHSNSATDDSEQW